MGHALRVPVVSPVQFNYGRCLVRKYRRRVYRAFKCRDCKGVVSAEDSKAGRCRRYYRDGFPMRGKLCLCCAARRDRRQMREVKPGTKLWMSVEIERDPDGRLSRRCEIGYGQLKFIGWQNSSGHNWYRCKTVRVWFTGPDGYEWYGRGCCHEQESYVYASFRRTKRFIGERFIGELNIVDELWDQLGGAA